jgi:hypothetical protein
VLSTRLHLFGTAILGRCPPACLEVAFSFFSPHHLFCSDSQHASRVSARMSHKFFLVLCIPIQLGASRNASFEFSNLAFVWKGNCATNVDGILHVAVNRNNCAAMSDFIQFVRITVPISSWISSLLTGIRGQAQRLLPLVVSSRRHLCAVCGQLPLALPMVHMCMQFPLLL